MQVDELPLLLAVSRKLDVRPVIGVRAKLSTKHDGHWGGTSGDKGKFGLTIPEIVKVVYTLREVRPDYASEMRVPHGGSRGGAASRRAPEGSLRAPLCLAGCDL